MDDEPEMPAMAIHPVTLGIMSLCGAALWCGMFKLAAALLRATMGVN
jgi:hypothetical protein